MSGYRILTMNFGSTSTKAAVFQGEEVLCNETLRHSREELAPIKTLAENAEFRLPLILSFLERNEISLESLDAVVGRGGLTRPIQSGTYAVNEAMLEDLLACRYGTHACNLGAILADKVAKPLGLPAYVVDPGVVDELCDMARLSGHPDIPRRSVFHALNQKAMARRFAAENGKKYDELNLIVAHMGGGITVGAHKQGQVVDVSNGTDGEGPYSAERTGSLPFINILQLVESGAMGDTKELRKLMSGGGGLAAYLGTTDGRAINERVQQGDEYAELVYHGMAYQIAKEIGAMGAVLCGKVDQIILTGGLAYDEMLMGWIKEQVSFLAPVTVYPGEDELTALKEGAERVLRGEEEARTY
ncbi:MAG: butyrate kinase [Bacillota bacterium]|nr:butyrate kinase [Bacillota bacterium]